VQFRCNVCQQRYYSTDEPAQGRVHRVFCIACGGTITVKGADFPALPTSVGLEPFVGNTGDEPPIAIELAHLLDERASKPAGSMNGNRLRLDPIAARDSLARRLRVAPSALEKVAALLSRLRPRPGALAGATARLRRLRPTWHLASVAAGLMALAGIVLLLNSEQGPPALAPPLVEPLSPSPTALASPPVPVAPAETASLTRPAVPSSGPVVTLPEAREPTKAPAERPRTPSQPRDRPAPSGTVPVQAGLAERPISLAPAPALPPPLLSGAASPPAGAKPPEVGTAPVPPASPDEAGLLGSMAGAGVDVADVAEPRPRAEFKDTIMTAPTLVSGPDPEYSEKAIERGVEGLMVVKCVVTVAGTVHDCRVLKGLPYMDRAVVDALERRRYTPAALNGKPLEVDYTFKIRLALPR
jgi:periplasmic protein TonB